MSVNSNVIDSGNGLATTWRQNITCRKNVVLSMEPTWITSAKFEQIRKKFKNMDLENVIRFVQASMC